MRRKVAWVGALLCVVGLASCGVPLQTTAEPIPPDVIPSPVSVPSPSPSPSPSSLSSASPSSEAEPISRLRLWFVQDEGLAAVESSLPSGSSPDYVIVALAAGPTPEQVDQGLRTIARDPLTGQPLASIAPPAAESPAASGPPVFDNTPGPVTVQLSKAFTALPPGEQVLLLGQVVLSLTGAGESSVAFVDAAGAPVAVPLPDGRLLDVPARARDYAPLIVRP